MTATTVPGSHSGVAALSSDIRVVAARNVTRLLRSPRLIVFSTIQPIMFVLLFNYVFGGAIAGSQQDYINFLLPGIFAQTALFGSTQTGIALQEDLSKGIIDRFKSLPMARSAVLAGRTIADALRQTFVVLLMTAVGLLIGFRPSGNLLEVVAAVALAVLLGYSFSWISVNIGLRAGSAEAAQAAGFIWVFPLVFASSAFVPTRTMPSWLQAFAEVTPVTYAIDAMRGLMAGTPRTADLVGTLAWCGAIMAVFVPLAVRAYRKAA